MKETKFNLFLILLISVTFGGLSILAFYLGTLMFYSLIGNFINFAIFTIGLTLATLCVMGVISFIHGVYGPSSQKIKKVKKVKKPQIGFKE